MDNLDEIGSGVSGLDKAAAGRLMDSGGDQLHMHGFSPEFKGTFKVGLEAELWTRVFCIAFQRQLTDNRLISYVDAMYEAGCSADLALVLFRERFKES